MPDLEKIALDQDFVEIENTKNETEGDKNIQS